MVAFFVSTSLQEIDMHNNTLKKLLAAAAAAAMLGAAPVHAQAPATQAQKPGASMPSAAAPSAAAPTAAAPAGAALGKADQKIVMDMAQANMAEIASAKVAQSKSQNDQVKTFAQQMIDDHTKALTEVQQLATTKGVTLPTDVDKKHKAMNDKMSGMSGDAFDKAYLAQSGLADHKKAHSMLVSAEKKAKDPDVRALAGRLQPTVDQHLKAAQQMGSAKAKPATATEAGK
jgi:putative membrane protein